MYKSGAKGASTEQHTHTRPAFGLRARSSHQSRGAPGTEDDKSKRELPKKRALRKPVRASMLKAIVSFVCFAVLSVLLFAASGPLMAAVAPLRPRRLSQVTHTYHARVPPHQVVSAPPPPPALVLHVGTTGAATSHPPPPVAISSDASQRLVDGKGAIDPGGAARIAESSPLIQGMIEAGFSRGQSVEALQAVGAKSSQDIPKAIQWSLRQGADRNLMEFRMEREVQSFEKMDFDGVRQPVSSPRPLVSLGSLLPRVCLALTAYPGGAGSTLSRTVCAAVGRQASNFDPRGVWQALSGVETEAAGQLCVQHLRVLPTAQVLRSRGIAAGQHDGPMLAQAPAGSEQPAGQHPRRLLLSLPPASPRGATTRAVASRGGRAQREQS